MTKFCVSRRTTVRSISTGFRALDEKLSGGLAPGSLTLIAGRTSMGKSSFALQVAASAARDGRRVVFFSVEMPAAQVATRLLSLESGVPASVINGALNGGKRLSSSEAAAINLAIAEVSELPLVIADAPGLKCVQAMARCRQEKPQRGLDLVILDHVHEMNSDTQCLTPLDRYSDIARAVKNLARELDVPVLAAAQLNRAADGREGNEPNLSELSQSGILEQVSDCVLMLLRPGYYTGNDDPTTRVFVRKNRNGPCGTIDLKFEARTMTFNEDGR